jgi:hypothetical protein
LAAASAQEASMAEQAAVACCGLARESFFSAGNWAERGKAAKQAAKKVASRKRRINLPLVCVWDISSLRTQYIASRNGLFERPSDCLTHMPRKITQQRNGGG